MSVDRAKFEAFQEKNAIKGQSDKAHFTLVKFTVNL
jgi:hypothetical protein